MELGQRGEHGPEECPLGASQRLVASPQGRVELAAYALAVERVMQQVGHTGPNLALAIYATCMERRRRRARVAEGPREGRSSGINGHYRRFSGGAISGPVPETEARLAA